MVLETMEPGIMDVGQWVNVIGYVVDGDATDQARGVDAHVQALMMWSTGPLDVHEYEKAVEDGLIVVDAAIRKHAGKLEESARHEE